MFVRVYMRALFVSVHVHVCKNETRICMRVYVNLTVNACPCRRPGACACTCMCKYVRVFMFAVYVSETCCVCMHLYVCVNRPVYVCMWGCVGVLREFACDTACLSMYVWVCACICKISVAMFVLCLRDFVCVCSMYVNRETPRSSHASRLRLCLWVHAYICVCVHMCVYVCVSVSVCMCSFPCVFQFFGRCDVVCVRGGDVVYAWRVVERRVRLMWYRGTTNLQLDT
jgi:hypothetical protein